MQKMIRAASISAAFVLGALFSPNALAEKKPLMAGDNAPALQVAKWIKGKPIPKFEKGKIYVVEFWATWCGPCKQSIPHLTALAKKFKGKATITGVSVWEERKPKDESYMKKVASFVDNMGSKMDYNVAADGKAGVVAKTWMEAAQQDGIPTAFVVGKDAKILWIGHPMMGLDRVLHEVVAGTFNAKAEAERTNKAMDAQRKMAEIMQPLNKALQAQKWDEALAQIDKVLQTNPQMADNLLNLKYRLLLQTNETEAYKLAKELAEDRYKDNAMMLNQIAWFIVDDRMKLKNPDVDLAVLIAERAAELTKNEDFMILDTLAYAVFKKGDLDRAISLQEKAVALMAKGGEVDDQTKKEIAERLTMFKKKKE